jgi:hypothetical protein
VAIPVGTLGGGILEMWLILLRLATGRTLHFAHGLESVLDEVHDGLPG